MPQMSNDPVVLQAELTRARQEAVERRQALSPYKEAFSGLSDEAITWVLETFRLAQSDNPIEAGKRFTQLAANFLGEVEFKQHVDSIYEGSPMSDVSNTTPPSGSQGAVSNPSGITAPGTTSSSTQTFSLEDVQKLLDDQAKKIQEGIQNQQQEQYQQQEATRIFNEAVALGYKTEQTDPDSWKFGLLLSTLATMPDSSTVADAHQLMVSRGVAPQAQTGTTPPPPPATTQTPSPPSTTQTLQEQMAKPSPLAEPPENPKFAALIGEWNKDEQPPSTSAASAPSGDTTGNTGSDTSGQSSIPPVAESAAGVPEQGRGPATTVEEASRRVLEALNSQP